MKKKEEIERKGGRQGIGGKHQEREINQLR